MTHWNYRVIKRTYDTGEAYYSICEAYYTEDGSVSMYSGPRNPHGETPEGLKETLSWMQLALDKPVLDEKDLIAKDA